MLIEQTTTYAYKLKYLENPSFDKVRNLAKKFIDELPKELVDDLYNSINRGVDILKNEPEMLMYLYSFGNMHQAKLNFAFDKIPEVFFSQPEINIIDYGCGQAIGTMCYADFLKSKNYNQKIKSVTLIEPSEICIKRGALHTSVFLLDAKIVTVNKTFDELVEDDFYCEENVPTLHILSNVLDLLCFDLEKFAELVKERLQGYNQFICVGPYFGFAGKDEIMEEFAAYMSGVISFSKTLGKGQFKTDKNWTCQVVVFVVYVDNLSTKVTNQELENKGVEDKYNVVYSKDGKRLLKSKNTQLKKYEIKYGTKVICDWAFGSQDCNNINNIFVFGPELKEITIPDSVTKIGDSSFFGCEYLKQMTIPNSVTTIGKSAFRQCRSLKCVTIPDSVTKISDYAFDQCKSLKQITIPNSVTLIGDCSFSGCKSLQQIVIPDSVITIGNCAFMFCESLKQITLSNSVTTIGKTSFMFCKSLKQIFIPYNSVEKFQKMLPHYLWKYIFTFNN